jgi:hypothetical protein
VTDDAIRAEILRLCHDRGAGKTICPSDAARALCDDWRALMPEIRRVAAGMPEIIATQKAVPVDPLVARGPIRLGLARD